VHRGPVAHLRQVRTGTPRTATGKPRGGASRGGCSLQPTSLSSRCCAGIAEARPSHLATVAGALHRGVEARQGPLGVQKGPAAEASGDGGVRQEQPDRREVSVIPDRSIR